MPYLCFITSNIRTHLFCGFVLCIKKLALYFYTDAFFSYIKKMFSLSLYFRMISTF